MSKAGLPAGIDGGRGRPSSRLSRRAFVKAAGVGAASAALPASALASAAARMRRKKMDAISDDAGEVPLSAATFTLRKHIYLTKRKPDFTRDQFIVRWRKHGALAMSQSFFGYM